MRKNRSAIAAILLAVSMMTACAGGQNAVTAIQGSASQTAGTEAAAAASSAETKADKCRDKGGDKCRGSFSRSGRNRDPGRCCLGETDRDRRGDQRCRRGI